MTTPAQLTDALVRDARFALRVLRKSPAFTATAVLTLALGIGANATVFSMVDTLLLRSLPYPEPDRLAVVSTVIRTPDGSGGEQTSQDGHTWEVLRDHAELTDLAVTGMPTGVNLYAGDRAVHLDQQRVSAGFFRVLGVAPRIGREFTPEEDRQGGPAVAILSHGLWQRAFGGDPAVVGGRVLLRGEPHTVVGVMPEGFRGTFPADPAELWTPLRPSTTGEGGGTNYQIVGRLAPGVSWEQAGNEVDALAGPAWSERFGEQAAEAGVSAQFSLVPLGDALTEGLRWPLFLLWSAVGLVLVVVCANLASLMLARSSGRSREIAARIALGGGRGAVMRQILVESLVLAAAGGALGIAVGALGSRGLSALAADTLHLVQPVALDARVAGLMMALALAASLAFGLWPALHVSSVDPRAALADGGGRGASGGSVGWPRRVLVTAEVAVGVVLLVFAGLLVRTFVNLRSLDPGFDQAGVVAGGVSLQDARYETRERIAALVEESLEGIRRTPGVEDAAVSLRLPFERLLNLGFRTPLPDGGMSDWAAVSTSYVTPGFFETLRIPLLQGRTLEAADGPGRPRVAVVNQRFVEERLPESAGLGARFELGGEGEQYEIVGVVGSVQQSPRGLGGRDPLAKLPVVYVPLAQVDDETFVLVHTWFDTSWIVRSSLPTEQAVAGIRQALHAVDPRLPFVAFREMDEVRSGELGLQRFLMTLAVILAGLAAFLVALGLHGLVAHTVADRTRELGIRMALGSTMGQAVRAVLQPMAVLTLAGVAVGAGLALAGSRFVGAFVYGVSATDPWTILAAAAALLLVAASASVGPGLRVLRLDPARTLREE